MALFGKKESEGKSNGGQPSPIKKDKPKEKKKIAPRGSAVTAANDAAKDTTYLGKSLKVKGNISGAGNLIVLGKFDGEFEIKGQLKVAQGAVVKGSIKATGVSINGKMDGTIVASEKILLDTAASMKGRLVTPKISIQDGAVFDGELQMSKPPDQVQKAAVREMKPAPKAAAVSEIK